MTTESIIYKGIDCYVVWDDEESPTWNYISFGVWDEELHDSFGVRDDRIFYYFDSDEVEALATAIANGDKSFKVDPDWHIDLSQGFEYQTV
jgi:hypothetical protein